MTAASLPALVAQALEAHQRGELATAEQLYRQVLAAEPHTGAAASLGALLRASGRGEEAEALYRWALQHCMVDEILLANACNLLRERGHLDDTVALLQRGLARAPQSFVLRQGLALSLHHQGALEQALGLQQVLLQEQPEHVDVLMDHGACLAKRQRLEEGLACFERVLALEPGNIRCQVNRITLLVDLGRLEEAAACLEQHRRGGVLPEELQEAQASLLMARNQVEEAEAVYRQLCEREPHKVEHWLNRSACERALKFMVAPLASLQRALAVGPERLDVKQSLAALLVDHGRGEEALPLLLDTAAQPEAKDLHHFALHFCGSAQRLLPAPALAERIRAWEQQSSLSPAPLWADHIRDPDPDRVLRVAYLSPDFANHPVGRFIEPVLAGHDRSRVQVIGLHCGRHHDGVTERLRQACDHWREIRYGSDERVAREIAELQPDVLVELGGYTGDQRIRLLTARPAPIQLSYLGYFACTHLQCIDGWIGDPVLFPAGLEAEAEGQRLHRLNRCYMAYRPHPAPEPKRTAPDGRFRFGSFNHSRKLVPAALDLFAAVLMAVPESLLVLKSISFVEEAERERIGAALAQRGIGAERLELLPWVAGGENHMALYGRMDAALDPIPYGGATTTAEALWMGVPVLAMAGEGMVGRLSASLLAGAGLEAGIATGVEDYLHKAQLLARVGPRSRELRLALRQRLQQSALMDERGLVDSLEGLYRQLWQERPLRARL